MARVQNLRVDNDRGALLAEYGLLLILAAIASIGIVLLLGEQVWALFSAAESEFDSSRQIPPPAD